MYLGGEAPLPSEYGFMELGGLKRGSPPTPESVYCSRWTAPTRAGWGPIPRC